MTSPLLALFARSLREDTRRKATYFARVGLVILILLFLLTVRSSFGWGNAPGLRFFESVVFIDFWFIVLASLSLFSSAITEEKEEMTLGLLRMTNLNALSILLGKSTSRVVNALLLLAAQIPFTLLAVSLGGVAVRQIVAAYWTLAAFIIFLANLALLASVVCRRTTGAAVLTGSTLFVFFAVVPFLRWASMIPIRLGLIEVPSTATELLNRLADAVALTSPYDRLSAVVRTGFSGSPAGVQVWSNLAIGLLCFLLAWAVFEIFCDEQHEATQPRSLVARRTSALRALGAGRAWSRALAWKDFHFLTGGKVWMALKLALYAIVPLLFAKHQWRWRGLFSIEQFGYVILWISIFNAAAEVALIAASIFRQERQWKTLSSLATLPMSMRQIAYQKILGCVPALIPAFLYLGLGLYCIRADLNSATLHRWLANDLSWMSYVAAQFVLFLHVVAALSLHFRRGALPAAIALHFVWNMMVGIGMAVSREEGTTPTLTFLCLVGAIALHFHIGRRLEALAAET
jgi:ABC-type Na+ efflux pump permease subunit